MATILVVDDEMGIRELLSEILGDEGYVVEVAENAQQAREFRLCQEPDLVLLDIWMPDTDGVTLLKEWGAQGLLTMPVIMMSGHATIDTAVEATKIGALNFLEKPIALQKLLKAVERGLTHHAAAPVQISHDDVQEADMQASVTLSAVTAAAAAVPAGEGRDENGMLQQAMSIPFNMPLRDARDAFERAYFEYHIAQEKGSMTRIAEKTGLERTHLYRKLKQLGVDLGKPRERMDFSQR